MTRPIFSGDLRFSAINTERAQFRQSRRETQSTPQSSKSEEEDSVTISAQAKSLSEQEISTETTNSAKNLSGENLDQMKKLKDRDREVRSHEQAHLSALGQYSKGGASFEFQTGPDGQRYAVGGEVSVDLAKEDKPEATVAKMAVIKKAAMAPQNPSSQDRQVAAQATRMEAEARSEMSKEQAKEIDSATQENSRSDAVSSKNQNLIKNYSPENSSVPVASSVNFVS
ncbi:MAG: catalase [Deltaproteobacteria bacterium]|nr:catalase [Deltaproteobacteria bacterium]